MEPKWIASGLRTQFWLLHGPTFKYWLSCVETHLERMRRVCLHLLNFDNGNAAPILRMTEKKIIAFSYQLLPNKKLINGTIILEIWAPFGPFPPMLHPTCLKPNFDPVVYIQLFKIFNGCKWKEDSIFKWLQETEIIFEKLNMLKQWLAKKPRHLGILPYKMIIF